MGKKKKASGRKGANRFFRWIRSDLPDEEDKKSPVLLLGVNKISDSPFFVRRRLTDPHSSGSIRFFRPPKSKYTRGLNGDERLEKIRQDLLVHKHKPDTYIPKNKHDVSLEPETRGPCIKLSCVGNCICDRKKSSSNRGSFSFHRPENRQSSLCPSEPYGTDRDNAENDIEFKYTEHIPDVQPSSSKQNSYNVTPTSTERRHILLSNLNERFRKTLSLDSRKIETNRVLSLPQEPRPKSLVNTGNICVQYTSRDPFIPANFEKASQPKKKRKSFFSLDTFFDSKKSDTSSIDDYCSSKYKRFELESDDSPIFRRDVAKGEKTPDLLNLPVIIDSVRKKQSDTKRQLEKLENHYYRSLNKTRTVIDAVPADATDEQGPSGCTNRLFVYDDDVEYIEPIRSTFTSQSTLILDKNIDTLKPDSILTINTEDTDIKLPSSVSPNSNKVGLENDLDSIGAYEIEVKESDLKECSKKLVVKVMDKSVDSIGSCSLDVDASTDFSDTTSGSLNLLTPSSTTSRIRDFTSRIQERASNLQNISTPLAPISPARTPDNPTPTPRKTDNLLRPPPKIHLDTSSHRSRSHLKKRDELPQKKPSYLNLACSVNGYTNLTTYDSKLRQDINKSREASPIRPITHTYQYKSESNSLLVPIPVSANKLLVPTFGPHDTSTNLTPKAPSKAHTDPHIASPSHAYMAAENKQLKNDFLGPSMTTTSRPFLSNEGKNFAASMLHQKDEVDNVKEMTFKSSYSETNFRQTVTTNGKESRFSSESYTISSNGVSKRVEITKENGEKLTSPMKSFIQQRVERLYGPGALAQGFFNQKRYKLKSSSEDEDSKVLTEKSLNCPNERFVSPRKSNESFDSENICISPTNEDPTVLPVLRHLRPEFRAQLPVLSPRKSVKSDLSPQKLDEDIPEPKKTESVDEIASEVTNGVSVIDLDEPVKEKVNGVSSAKVNGEEIKDGHYFINLEKKETERLIAMAVGAEKELENLQDQDISEEVLGFLRAASGKARLLATQKMQQFEGLCYNHLNESGDEPFPTTLEDLQGFWDMVCLQVRNVEALYQQIELLKANNWKEIVSPMSRPQPSPVRARSRTPAVKNEKARLAAEKRETERKAMLEHRRRVARERQLAARTGPGAGETSVATGHEPVLQEVEIFVGKGSKPSKTVPGDCKSSEESFAQS